MKPCKRLFPVYERHNLRHGEILGVEILRHAVVTADFLKGRGHLGLPENAP